MPRRKASSPGTSDAPGARRKDQLGRFTTGIGFLLPHGREGVEAFDADTRSLGLFSDQRSAAVAVAVRCAR